MVASIEDSVSGVMPFDLSEIAILPLKHVSNISVKMVEIEMNMDRD